MTRQQAGDLAISLGLPITLRGNSDPAPGVRVIAQSPPPGTKMEKGEALTLEFADTTVRE